MEINFDAEPDCTSDVVVSAYRHFCEYFYGTSNPADPKGMELWSFLGDDPMWIPNAVSGKSGWKFKNKRTIERVRALAGPHWQTMIKVIEARNEQETHDQLSATA